MNIVQFPIKWLFFMQIAGYVNMEFNSSFVFIDILGYPSVRHFPLFFGARGKGKHVNC